MIFYKTSSFGNDFIEIDLDDVPEGIEKGGLASPQGRRPQGVSRDPQGQQPLGGLVRQICDRQRGLGADGVVVYKKRGKNWHFQIFNRDGGAAELSGNGMAGLAAVLFQRRLARSPLALHAAIGTRRVELLGRDGAVFRLGVEIGRPDFSDRGFFPFLRGPHGRRPLGGSDGSLSPYRAGGLDFHPVSVGNPHAVVICPEMPAGGGLAGLNCRRPLGGLAGLNCRRPLGGLAGLNCRRPLGGLEALGKKLEGHPMFPKRVNVEFVELTSPARCRVYFYERGVGPTQASSTGSAAVFAVLRRLKLAGDRLAIEPAAGKGETIGVNWRGGIFIDNVTSIICRGEYFF